MLRAGRPLLILSLVGFSLSPNLWAEQSMEEALEAYRANMEKMRSQGMDLGDLGRAFEEVQRGAERGQLPLPGGGDVQGGVTDQGSQGRVRLPDGSLIQGQATESGAAGTVELPGGLRVQGQAGPDGAGGTVELPGGWKIRGNAGAGMPSGDITGPDGQSLSGMLGKMFQGMNQGGMYTAGIRGLQTTVAMLKANGLETSQVEAKIQQLLPQLQHLDGLSQQMLQFGSQGKAPPEKLVQELERRSDALDPQMEELTSDIEALTEDLGGAIREQMGLDQDEDDAEDGSDMKEGLQRGLQGLGNLMKGWGN